MVNHIFQSYAPSLFEVMSRLAGEVGAINLGQGFPEGMEPSAVITTAREALDRGDHQYPPSAGTPDLRRAVAEAEDRFYGITVDPVTEVVVTCGATEALAATILGLFEPGDEVIVFYPLYDSYRVMLARAGVKAVPVPLTPPHWTLPMAALERAVTPRTRGLLLNTPMNPTGKVFSMEELAVVASLAQRHDLIVICDEVYEHIVFDGLRHVPLRSLPGMHDRTIRIGSAGKTFSLTGWKVGHATGPAPLIAAVSRAHQYITFATPPHLQTAVAAAYRLGDDYFSGLTGGLRQRRDLLAAGLADIGFKVLPAQGTYFLLADVASVLPGSSDVSACHQLVREAGVAAIPGAAFWPEGGPSTLIRLCFAKRPETLREALHRLAVWMYGRATPEQETRA